MSEASWPLLSARLQAASAGGHHLAYVSRRVSTTTIYPGNGPEAHHALRLKLDHPMGQANRAPESAPLGRSARQQSAQRQRGSGPISMVTSQPTKLYRA